MTTLAMDVPAPRRYPTAGAVLALLKPVTWFPPMWAFGCGVVASGVAVRHAPGRLLLGVLLAGPLVCAASQAANDWYDRFVDAINEPQRPIPSGRMPGRWGLAIAIGWSVLGLAVGALLGPWGLGATALGLALAWAYSMPPLRLKENGWWGNLACGLCYESLAWVTGTAVMLGGAAPSPRVLLVALLYGIGAHGIMTINDYKSIEGDRRMGVRSLPVQLGPHGAAGVAAVTMLGPQVIVVTLLLLWGRPVQGAIVAAVTLLQVPLLRRWMAEPARLAPWYNGTGVTAYVSGMMAAAVALAGLAA